MSRSPHAHALLRACAAALTLVAVACSSGTSSVDPPEVDGGVDGGVDVSKTSAAVRPRAIPALARVTTLAARDVHLRETFAPNPKGLAPLADAAKGFGSVGYRAHPDDASRMGAVLPPFVDAAWRVGAGKVDKWSAKLSPIGVEHAEATVDEGRVVYPDAWPATDVVVASGERGIEWVLALRDPSAPTSFEWSLELGSDLSVRKDRLPDGSIDLVDGKGDAALRVHPAFAIDAAGTRRDVAIEIVDGALRVSIDPKGLVYPILVDPVVSVPVWQLLSTGGAAGGLGTSRAANALAFHSPQSAVLSIGGTIPGFTNTTETKALTGGTTWSAFGALPTGLSHAAAATAASGRAYGYGGCTNALCSTMSGAAFVGGAAAWSGFCGVGALPACGPGARAQAGLAAIGDQLVLFGGATWDSVGSRFAPLNDTWVADLSSGATTFTKQTVTTPPKLRRGAAFVGAPGQNVAMLFGGGGSQLSELFGDTWLWKKTGPASGEWQCVCSCTTLVPGVPPCPGEPGPRAFASATWDAARKKFVLFGGFAQYGDGYAQSRGTWDFDPATLTWTPLCYEGGPDGCTITGREQAGAAYDPIAKRVVVAGGQEGGSFSGDTWRLYVRGGKCSSNGDCDTGYCVEGTCCETSSCPICQTCASDSSPGTCANVTALKADPLDRCDACDGSGACKKAFGVACTAGTECASGYCTDSVCCETSACGSGSTCANPAGKCRKILGSSCTLNLECASGNCVDGTCCSTSSCPSGARCDYPSAGGSCKRNNGQGCTTSAECGSGYCVDGYCCNGACSAQCAACDIVKGTCTPVLGAPHGSRTACAGSGTCKSQCNGADVSACHYPGSTVSCGSASCSSGSATAVGTCNGAGGCDQASTSCGTYQCGATTCKTSCTTDADCTTGDYCQTGSCVAKRPQGTACSSASQCASGNCVDGVCCGTSSCASGSACNGASNPGTCTKVNGTTCSSAAECGSGQCVDGVCCDSACTGQCQACNQAGNVGKCTTVLGAPVGARAACSGAGAGTTCGPRCDGVDPSACHHPGVTTSCGAPSCSGGVESSVSTCDGAGACKPASKACGAYVCGATACKTTCATNADCNGGYYCKSGACAAKEADGTTCTAGGAASCASGNCVDGVCCGSSACASGAKCNVPGASGKCAKPNGVACTSSTECGSGFCVDGVCCDTACSGQCQACDATGKVGTCSAVAGAPHGSRPACTGTGAGTECGATCNGTDPTSCKYPTGSKSCGAATCLSGVETHVSVCNGAGSCSDTPTTCGGFLCAATACKTSCTINADCTTGYYCKSGACIPIEGLGTTCSDATTCTSGFCTDGVCCAVGSCGAGKSCSAGLTKGVCASLNGTTCVADAECASGACVDGVCCDSACDGSCEACNQPGSIGKCVPIVGEPLAGHPACSASPTDPSCGLRCDGTDGKACKYRSTTTSCGTPSCAAGIENQVSTCDGAGACKPATKSCGAYACGPTACLTGCTSSTDCASGHYCKDGSCVATEGLGAKCTDASQCKTGFCTDGVCCGVASCGEGSSCAEGPGPTAGQCLKTKGVACTEGTECASGSCVDGVCCDGACSGQCEACNVAGSEGTCTPVVGAPKGTRVACDALDTNDCAKRQCDGETRDKCVGFANGATTVCGAKSCTADKKFQQVGGCDGKGSCALPDPKPCTPYACDVAASSGCKSSCSADADCADGFTCDGGVCIQGAKCSEDGLSSIDKAGNATACTPYRCGTDGNCLKSCAGSDDCAPGTVCDTTVKACVVGAAPVADEGGCTTASHGRRTSLGAWALLGLVALASRRRASRSRL